MDPNRHYALLVGLLKYHPSVGDLKGTLNDLRDVDQWLENDLKVPRQNIVKWTDKPPDFQDPTASDFLKQLVKWDGEASRNGPKLGERLYVYYAGHGYNANTSQQSMIMPMTTLTTWDVVPMIPLRESLRLRAHFDEIIMLFDACRDVLPYAVDPSWSDKPRHSPSNGQVKVMSMFASKTGKKAKEVEFSKGEWHGVLTKAFLTAVKGYASDENNIIYFHTLRGFLFAAIKDQLGPDFEPDIPDEFDPNEPWPVLKVTRRLPRIVIQPKKLTEGEATIRRNDRTPVKIDLSHGIQVLEVPYGYYTLKLPDNSEQPVIAVWEEKIVEV
jgi:hypothetical protein